MKLGKISNNIYDRSVFKLIGKHGDNKLKKPNIGMGAVVVSNTSNVVVAQASSYKPILSSINEIVTKGEKLSVVASIVMNEKAREIRLKEIMAELDSQCATALIQLSGVNVTVSRNVNAPVINITAFGKENRSCSGVAKPGQDIVMTGFIGKSGMNQVIQAKRDEILKMYSEDFISKAYTKDSDLLIETEAEIARSSADTGYAGAVGEGGILAAIWNMAEYSNVGVEIQLRDIEVNQEIIEICELFNINVYELESMGCLLMTSDDGCGIVNKLGQKGIKASIIGRVVEGNKKVVHNLDEDRFMELPKQDQLFSIYCNDIE